MRKHFIEVEMGKYVKDEEELLGVTTVRSKRRKLAEKEGKRFKGAKETLVQLRVLPLKRNKN